MTLSVPLNTADLIDPVLVMFLIPETMDDSNPELLFRYPESTTDFAPAAVLLLPPRTEASVASTLLPRPAPMKAKPAELVLFLPPATTERGPSAVLSAAPMMTLPACACGSMHVRLRAANGRMERLAWLASWGYGGLWLMTR